MCVAVSGRCFMSQFTQGKKFSANRGACAQLCRRSYTITDDSGNELKLENSRVLSPKDLCTIPFIEKMKSAGIKSFKIEGRNRPPEYVYTVVSEYRKALDKKLSKEEIKDSIKNLKKVYNRGFSSGFYMRAPTSDDFSTSENGEQTEIKEFVGRIEKFWPKVNSAGVKMFAGKLSVGDEVYLINDSDSIIRTKVTSIEIEGKSLNSTKKGEFVGVNFGIPVKKGTDVYLIKLRKDL